MLSEAIVFLCFWLLPSHINGISAPSVPVTKDNRLIWQVGRQSCLTDNEEIHREGFTGGHELALRKGSRLNPHSAFLHFYLVLWCFGVFLLYVCMCVKANAWPFSLRINGSSVAAVTGEIRDWLCLCLSHHPSSSAASKHVCPCTTI